jgi:hypothetical protein
MDTMIKKYWKVGLIVILALFGLSKCTQSCNRASKINEANIEIDKRDSIIDVLKDSCTTLNTTIQVYQERVSGMQQTMDIQSEATKRISEAKKNINVKLTR